MAANGFVCEADINLHLLSTLGNHECPSQFIYLTFEIFGKVHKTKPQHAYYPLVLNETIQVEKTFWSPATEVEVLDMLEDAQVVVELKRIDPCFYNGLLLAYYDGTVKDLLFSPHPRIPCSTNGREMYLNGTVDFKGTVPRLRYSAFANIKRLGGDHYGDSNSGKYVSMYNRIDDGYYSPNQSLKDVSYKSVSRQSRSPKRSPSPTLNGNISPPYYTRQTVSSAIRSRSPSPIGNRSVDKYDEKEYETTGDSGLGHEKVKEPFVVRRVPDNLILRSPKLHDSLPRAVGRSRGRSRSRRPRQSSSRNKVTSSSNIANTEPKRFRSASLSKSLSKSLQSGLNIGEKEVENRLTTYTPASIRSSYNLLSSPPHRCYDYTARCHSPMLDYYSDRLARLTRGYGDSYRCHSHCCHW